MNTTVINSFGSEISGSFEDSLKAADLNWQVKSDTVAGSDTGISMPRKKLLYRSDNQQALGVVGSDYDPTDPKEFLESQFEFASFLKGKVVRAGFIPDRSRAFAFIRVAEDITLPRNLRAKGDPTAVYLYSTDGWDGGTPRRSRLYLERIVCANGMRSRSLSAGLWVSHVSGMTTRYEPKWKDFLREIGTTVSQVREEFKTLASERMSKEQMEEFLKKLVPGDGGQSESRRAAISGFFQKEETGNLGNSCWDAYNAVTEWATHHRPYRQTDTTPREVNRFLGVLETDTMRERAYELLLN